MKALNQSNRSVLYASLPGLVLLQVSSVVNASQVNYSNCPGYPLSACPPGYSAVAIPDNNANGVELELYVPHDSESFITDVDVWFYITHTYQGDLRVVLTSPAGSSVELVNRPGFGPCGLGFSVDNFGYVTPNFFLHEFVLDDSAATTYSSPAVGCPGITNVEGAWRPIHPLSLFDSESKVGNWKLFIADWEAQDVGTLWVWGMTITTEPATPPVVDIAMPDDYACACQGDVVIGTASDPDGTFINRRLEWSVDSAGPWSLIDVSSIPVASGVLGTFPPAMPEGYSYVRLTATNVIGQAGTFVKVIHQDRAFSGAAIVEPEEGDIVGGSVCLNKVSASDYCFASAALAFAPSGGAFTTFYSTTSPVQVFPSWNTTALADGNYTLRVTGTSTCGYTASDVVSLIVDNTPPVAVIASPQNCASLDGFVQVVGTVTDAHLSGWTLQYTGGPTNGWQTIASGSEPIVNGVLANWNTNALPPCSYTLRLLASDASAVSCFGSNGAEFLTSVEIGGVDECLADLDTDGDVDLMDYADFATCVVGPGGNCICNP